MYPTGPVGMVQFIKDANEGGASGAAERRAEGFGSHFGPIYGGVMWKECCFLRGKAGATHPQTLRTVGMKPITPNPTPEASEGGPFATGGVWYIWNPSPQTPPQKLLGGWGGGVVCYGGFGIYGTWGRM